MDLRKDMYMSAKEVKQLTRCARALFEGHYEDISVARSLERVVMNTQYAEMLFSEIKEHSGLATMRGLEDAFAERMTVAADRAGNIDLRYIMVDPKEVCEREFVRDVEEWIDDPKMKIKDKLKLARQYFDRRFDEDDSLIGDIEIMADYSESSREDRDFMGAFYRDFITAKASSVPGRCMRFFKELNAKEKSNKNVDREID